MTTERYGQGQKLSPVRVKGNYVVLCSDLMLSFEINLTSLVRSGLTELCKRERNLGQVTKYHGVIPVGMPGAQRFRSWLHLLRRSRFLLRQTLPETPDQSLNTKWLVEFGQVLLLGLSCRFFSKAGCLWPQTVTLNRSDVHWKILLACLESRQCYPPVTPLATCKLCSSTKVTAFTRQAFCLWMTISAF